MSVSPLWAQSRGQAGQRLLRDDDRPVVVGQRPAGAQVGQVVRHVGLRGAAGHQKSLRQRLSRRWSTPFFS